MELYAPDWELSFYVPIVNLSQSSKVGRIAMANNATDAIITRHILLPTTPTKPIFLTPILKSSDETSLSPKYCLNSF